MCSFSGHGLFVNLNQHKIIYRLRYKTSNFGKLEVLMTRKLHHFELSRGWSKFPGGPRLKKVLNRSKYNIPIIKNLTGKFFSYFSGGACLKSLIISKINAFRNSPNISGTPVKSCSKKKLNI